MTAAAANYAMAAAASGEEIYSMTNDEGALRLHWCQACMLRGFID